MSKDSPTLLELAARGEYPKPCLSFIRYGGTMRRVPCEMPQGHAGWHHAKGKAGMLGHSWPNERETATKTN